MFGRVSVCACTYMSTCIEGLEIYTDLFFSLYVTLDLFNTQQAPDHWKWKRTTLLDISLKFPHQQKWPVKFLNNFTCTKSVRRLCDTESQYVLPILHSTLFLSLCRHSSLTHALHIYARSPMRTPYRSSTSWRHASTRHPSSACAWRVTFSTRFVEKCRNWHRPSTWFPKPWQPWTWPDR